MLFVSAGMLAHSAHNAMTRAGTNIFPTQPALALVRDGPFRRTRNPLYIAAAGVYLGIAFWVDGLAPFVLFPLVLVGLHWAIVLPEERYLEGKFADEYRTYRAQVRRWLRDEVPGGVARLDLEVSPEGQPLTHLTALATAWGIK